MKAAWRKAERHHGSEHHQRHGAKWRQAGMAQRGCRVMAAWHQRRRYQQNGISNQPAKAMANESVVAAISGISGISGKITAASIWHQRRQRRMARISNSCKMAKMAKSDNNGGNGALSGMASAIIMASAKWRRRARGGEGGGVKAAKIVA